MKFKQIQDLTIDKQYDGVVTPSPLHGEEVVNIYYLKQEAIKRVKHYLSLMEDSKILKISKEGGIVDKVLWESGNLDSNKTKYIGAIEELVTFYDLTKEELK